MIICKNCDNNLNKNGYFCKCGLTGESHSSDYTCENSIGSITSELILKLIGEIIEMHPYAVLGKNDTYCDYNDGWKDGLLLLKERLNI